MKVYSLSGNVIEEVTLPSYFYDEIREDLILRAILADDSKKYQPKGVFPIAGMQTSAEYIGRKDSYRTIKNRGISRLPREKLPKGRFGRVRIVPFSVKGRRAHPPKVEKKLVEKINKKEYLRALRSAISTTRDEKNGLPIIIENKIEEIKKTKDIINILYALRVRDDKIRKPILIVVNEDKGVIKAANNIHRVDAVVVKELTPKLLAPTSHTSKITIWSKSAIESLHNVFGG